MPMKAIYLMMMLGLAGASVSYRVEAPLDPATMRPSCKCCPQNFRDGHPSSCQGCGSGMIVGSK
jgi:hypothetical protein